MSHLVYTIVIEEIFRNTSNNFVRNSVAIQVTGKTERFYRKYNQRPQIPSLGASVGVKKKPHERKCFNLSEFKTLKISLNPSSLPNFEVLTAFFLRVGRLSPTSLQKMSPKQIPHTYFRKFL